MNWIDTQLLVYRAVSGHPARDAVEAELRSGPCGSTVLVLLELFHVLTRDYAVSRLHALAEAERLARSPMAWAGMSALEAGEILGIAARDSIASADAALLRLAAADRGVVVTLDRRLLQVCQVRGVAARNPIDRELAAEVALWEARHLPQKGLARVLRTVEAWLRGQEIDVADRFRIATEELTRLPT